MSHPRSPFDVAVFFVAEGVLKVVAITAAGDRAPGRSKGAIFRIDPGGFFVGIVDVVVGIRNLRIRRIADGVELHLRELLHHQAGHDVTHVAHPARPCSL